MALKPPEEKSALQRDLPSADWLPKSDWGGMVRFDHIAALTVWALLVSEAMATPASPKRPTAPRAR